ncbi:MAG: hypothetical protein HYW34_00820 [Candidatus Brennerbacteria bacterium]|nr:hypothetical protein [Candidatus Brennerbacteria bacterium]
MSYKAIIILLLTFASIPIVSLANGGDQRIVDGKYFINLSRSPFTPRIGDNVSFLASFADIEKNKLISEDLIVAVRIARLGDIGTGKRIFIFEKEKILVTGGILELPYSFAGSELHEIFFDFAFASNPQKIYKAPDFLIDVQGQSNRYNANQILMAIFGGFVVGLFVERLIKIIMRRKAK